MALKLPGINVQREYRRYYPASEVTGHLVGFTNIDDEGQEGLELAMNHWLEGEPGAKRVLKDRLGRSIENVESIRPPHHGKDLRTSIDLRLQYLAYRTLKAAVKTHNARSGSSSFWTSKPAKCWRWSTSRPTTRMIARSSCRALSKSRDHGYFRAGLQHQAADRRGRAGKRPVPAEQHRRYGARFRTVGAKKIEDSRNLGRISLTTILARSSNVGVTKLAMTCSRTSFGTR